MDNELCHIKYGDITHRTVDNKPCHIKYGDITHRTVDNEPWHIRLIVYASEDKNNPVQSFIYLNLFTGYWS